jgi:hypothetical protein
MYEFFAYKADLKYFRARDFLRGELPFTFRHWTRSVQRHMEGHMVHVGGDRTENEVVWTGDDDKLYLADFQGAWAAFLGDVKDEHKEIFREEIDLRLDSEFRHCGTLGKEFIHWASPKCSQRDDPTNRVGAIVKSMRRSSALVLAGSKSPKLFKRRDSECEGN